MEATREVVQVAPVRTRVLLAIKDELTADLLARSFGSHGFEPVMVPHSLGPFIAAASAARADVAVIQRRASEALRVARHIRSRGLDLPLLFLAPDAHRLAEAELLSVTGVGFINPRDAHVESLVESTLVLAYRGSPPYVVSSQPETAAGSTPGVALRLSPREREVLGYLASGMDNLKIAALLGISERAVKVHVTGLYRKLGCENRIQLALCGIQLGVRHAEN